MRHIVVTCFVTLILATGAWALASPSQKCAQISPAETDAIVEIRIGNSQASGVVVGQDLVLTVLHSIPANDSEIELIASNAFAEVLAGHQGYDLALLKVDTGDIKPLPLNLQPMYPGEAVWALGYRDHQINTTEGKYLRQNYRGLLTSAPIAEGYSGGALLHCSQSNYAMTGLLHAFTAKLVAGELINSGHSRAIPAKAIHNFLKEQGIHAETSPPYGFALK